MPLLNDQLGSYMFQQDNASCHVSKQTKEMFAMLGIQLLPWPPHSPDLSPIENLWGILKKRVYDGPNFKSLDEVWQRIETEVAKINECPNQIPNLYNNYFSKMCDILCCNGCLLK